MLPVDVPVDLSLEQAAQSAFDALPFSFKYVSTSHSLHFVSPLPSWYCPVGQSVQ
jgi:hypothetical protein